MKTHKTFDLETAVDQWRQHLNNSGDFNKDQQEELTSHLRDELDNLADNNLTDEERLLIAQQRIGSVNTLQAAYSQQQGLGIQKLVWGLQAILLLWFFNNIVTLFNYMGAKIILLNQIEGTLAKYSISFGLQALGIIPLLWVIKYLVKLHRAGQGAVKANLFIVGVLVLSIVGRIVYLQFGIKVTAVLESVMAQAYTMSLAPVVISLVLVIISWREYKQNKTRAMA